MHLRFVPLAAQPRDDRNAVVAKDHEAVVQVAHYSGQLQLEDAVQGRADFFGFGLIQRCPHVMLRMQPRDAAPIAAPELYTDRVRRGPLSAHRSRNALAAAAGPTIRPAASAQYPL